MEFRRYARGQTDTYTQTDTRADVTMFTVLVMRAQIIYLIFKSFALISALFHHKMVAKTE